MTERLMQDLKSTVRRRRAQFPEKTYTNQVLRSRDVLRKAFTPDALAMSTADQSDRESWAFLGKAQRASPEEISLLETALQRRFQRTGAGRHHLHNEEWQNLSWELIRSSLESGLLVVSVFSAASMPGSGGKVTVLGKGHHSTSVNHYTQIDYVHAGKVKPYVGIVHKLMALQLPQCASQLSIALIGLLAHMKPDGRALRGKLPHVSLDAIPLQDLTHKLAVARGEDNLLYFLQMARQY